jgi:hypothetical protein
VLKAVVQLSISPIISAKVFPGHFAGLAVSESNVSIELLTGKEASCCPYPPVKHQRIGDMILVQQSATRIWRPEFADPFQVFLVMTSLWHSVTCNQILESWNFTRC